MGTTEGGSENVELLVACNLDHLQQKKYKIAPFSVQPFMVKMGSKSQSLQKGLNWLESESGISPWNEQQGGQFGKFSF